jgi:hypothetical protein
MNISYILNYLRPGAKWMCWENDPLQIEWNDTEQVQPTLEEITAAWPEVQAAIASDDASKVAKDNLTQLRADIFPDLLAFIATLPGANRTIKDAAIAAATEKAKVRP